MKLLFVNGSPKPSVSSSGAILGSIRAKLGEGHEIAEIRPGMKGQSGSEYRDLDAIVIAFPLYVDALPSALLAWMTSFTAGGAGSSGSARDRRGTAVFAVCNCGFYEGIQTRSALCIVRNFAAKNGLSWRGGLGIGSGGMIEAVAKVPENIWIKRDVSRGIAAIAQGMLDWGKLSGEDRGAGSLTLGASLRFVNHGLPRFAYILSAHSGWRTSARRNGLRPEALKARPIPF